MKPIFIAFLVFSLTMLAGFAAVPLNAAAAVASPTPIEASIAGPGDSQSEAGLHTFAMACGILAFAAAAQQALSVGRLRSVRVKRGRN